MTTTQLRPTTKDSITIIRRKVMTLARDFKKLNPNTSQSLALKTAWAFVKSQDCKLLSFTTTKGEEKTRVVFIDWLAYNTPKGTGRPLKEGLKLFVDCAKWVMELPSTISSYNYQII